MATTVYSHRFICFAAETDPPPYEVPEGYLAVIRDISLGFGGGAITDYSVRINGVANFFVGQFTVISIPQAAHWEGRVVAYAGEIIVASAANEIDGAVSGYLLHDDLP